MDVKKFFADLIAIYRKPTAHSPAPAVESPAPSALVVDADAASGAGQIENYKTDPVEEDKAGAGNEEILAERYEVDRQSENEGSNAEGYEAGLEGDFDEGGQIDLEAKTPPKPSPSPEQPSQPESPAAEPPSS